MKTLMIKPGDMLEIPSHVGTNLYSVLSVCLGGLGQDSLIELEAINQSKGACTKGPANALVPLRMIEAGATAGIFTHTPKESLDSP